MNYLRWIAQQVRHQPGLEGAEWLWSRLRRSYHNLLDPCGRGVSVTIGGAATMRMPTEFVGGAWEKFEPESVALYLNWVRCHPKGIVLDVGCSIGIYAAIALFAEPEASVIAFDADLASIKATRRMAQHAAGDRLRLVFGFVADEVSECVSLAQAVESTSRLMDNTVVSSATRYACLGDSLSPDVPCRRLDDLFPSGFGGRACLIKCDVEGAEQIVLSGTTRLLSHHRPDLLLSVHPSALVDYGHSNDSLREFLAQLGYAATTIAVDHEEHWWCCAVA